MSSFKPETILNMNIFDYVCACAEEGDYGPLHDIGLGRDDIIKINQLNMRDVIRLSQTKAHILDIRVNRERLHNMLNSLNIRRKEDDDINQLIRMGAPQPMMQSLFAITPGDFTDKRKLFGLQDEGVGRAPEPSDDEQHIIYKAYEHLKTSPENMSARQWIDLAEETNISLRTIWQYVQQIQIDSFQLTQEDH